MLWISSIQIWIIKLFSQVSNGTMKRVLNICIVLGVIKKLFDLGQIELIWVDYITNPMTS